MYSPVRIYREGYIARDRIDSRNRRYPQHAAVRDGLVRWVSHKQGGHMGKPLTRDEMDLVLDEIIDKNLVR